MDGTPHLLTDVKFTERRRGYDPEEVDNFLERVSSAVAQLQDKLREATARAEQADARAADAQRARAAAEAQLSRGGAPDAVASAPAAERADPEVEAERASKILLMAQKTADATIEDANDTAQQTIADARAQASTLVSDAEAEAAKLRSDAKQEADELVERQRAAVVKDVRELEDVRASVQGDVEKLKTHLDEQRSRIRRGVEALALVLDDPEGLHVDEAPELSDRSMDDALAAEAGRHEQADEMVDVTDSASSDAAAKADIEGESRDEDVVVLDDGVDVSGVDLTGAPPARTPGGIFGAKAFDAGADAAPAGSPTASGSDNDFPAVAVPDLLRSERPDIDLAGDELFAAPVREERAGPPTQQFTPFTENEDPLGPPDDEADKAMRAFFETDFEAQEPEQKSRFGFRR